MIERVYVLHHMYEYGGKNEHEEIKLIGIFSCKELAEETVKKYKCLKGFSRYPEECFYIDEYEIDKEAGWQDGFVTSDEIDMNYIKIAECYRKWAEKDIELINDLMVDPINSDLITETFMTYSSCTSSKKLIASLEIIWLKYCPNTNKVKTDYIVLMEKLLSVLGKPTIFFD